MTRYCTRSNIHDTRHGTFPLVIFWSNRVNKLYCERILVEDGLAWNITLGAHIKYGLMICVTLLNRCLQWNLSKGRLHSSNVAFVEVSRISKSFHCWVIELFHFINRSFHWRHYMRVGSGTIFIAVNLQSNILGDIYILGDTYLNDFRDHVYLRISVHANCICQTNTTLLLYICTSVC